MRLSIRFGGVVPKKKKRLLIVRFYLHTCVVDFMYLVHRSCFGGSAHGITIGPGLISNFEGLTSVWNK